MSRYAAPPTNAPEQGLDINNCPNCAEPWVKSARYTTCWKCKKTPPSAMLAINCESDDRGDEPIDIGRATDKAVADGQFWMKFIDVADTERVRL
jgi:hypothetical protein